MSDYIMLSLVFLLQILWVISQIRRIFYYLSLWQIKEYRWRRFLEYFQSRRDLFINIHAKFRLGFIIYFVVIWFVCLFCEHIYGYIIGLFCLGGGYVFENIIFIREITKKSFRRPRLTKKILLLISLNLVSLAVVLISLNFTINLIWILFILMVVDLLLPIIITFFVFIFNPITALAKLIVINRARKYLQKYSHLKIIGITGSYGKSSTKEFLATVLSQKYKVFKTPKNINTEIGIANLILKTDFSEYDVFIVEMGAYQKGEIKLICKMVQPHIGILTAVNEQHLSLFKSIENTMQAKYELIESLPKNGLAIFNYDNERTRKLAEMTKDKAVFLYSRQGSKVHYFAKNIEVKENGLRFLACTKSGRHAEFFAPVTGVHNISNILAVIAVGEILQISLSEMAESLKKLHMPEGTMMMIKLNNDVTIIDDTYNANPDGIKAGIDYLHYFRNRKKIVIMSNMIELGVVCRSKHIEIGEKMGDILDYVLLLHSKYAEFVKIGLENKKFHDSHVFVHHDPVAVFGWLKSLLLEPCVILFEGRESKKVLELVKSYYLDFKSKKN